MEPKLLDAYKLAPGCDYITKGTPPGRVIDTGVDVDRHSKWGRIYLSERTVGEYARRLGWISPDDFVELGEKLAQANEIIADLEDRNERFERIREAIEAAGPDLFVAEPSTEASGVAAPPPVPAPVGYNPFIDPGYATSLAAFTATFGPEPQAEVEATGPLAGAEAGSEVPPSTSDPVEPPGDSPVGSEGTPPLSDPAPSDDGNDPGPEYPRDQGSGWYLLSNGEKVRGADEAHAAEAAIRRGEA